MAQLNTLQGEIDPEIAALLGAGAAEDGPPAGEAALLDDLLEGETGKADAPGEEPEAVQGGFPPITKKFEDVPHKGFADPNYYKIALSGEGDIAQRVHTILQKYISTKDPKDRSVFRQQLGSPYWEFLSGVARKAGGTLADPKKYLLRFAILHPTFLNEESREFFAKLVVNNSLGVPIHYLDEWFKGVGTGSIRNSTTDEAAAPRSNSQARLQQLLDKAMGKRDGTKGMLVTKNDERRRLEEDLKNRAAQIMDHGDLGDLPGIDSCYTEAQKRCFIDMQDLGRQLLRIDREMSVYFRDFQDAEEDVRTLRDKVEEEGAVVEVDTQAVDKEFETIRQMAKMTIGRQGNHFPLLSSEYFRCSPNDIAFRENVVAQLAWIESIDPEVFCRVYKNKLNRIVPYVILLPTYGDLGVCWEPFERTNRATSRGRVALPMYSKNLSIAVLSAVADLRWQVAKEKASFYWMEEGLTGNYYQWFTAQKLKGDVKEYFIQDYILWMTKESEGIQKLEKEIRGVFWRYMPFSQPVKEKLKTRSYVYQELLQRDANRAMSDGY